jgi:ubiquitin conjugation factor E4 B
MDGGGGGGDDRGEGNGEGGPQGRGPASWLDIRGWIQSGGGGAAIGAAAEEAPSGDQGGAAVGGPALELTADEIRAKRMAKLLQLQEQQEREREKELQSAAASAPVHSPKPSAAPVPAPVPAPSPPTASTACPMEVDPPAAPTPRSTAITLESRINASLRRVFLITLSASDAVAGSFLYLEALAPGDSEDGRGAARGGELSTDNLPEALAARIGMGGPGGVCLDYLISCILRCEEELSEVERRRVRPGETGTDEVLEALREAMQLLGNYCATCLCEPGVFAEPEEAPTQLKRMLLREAVPGGVKVLAYMLEKIDEQGGLQEFLPNVLLYLAKELSACRTSALDPRCGPAARSIAMICASYKPAAQALTSLPAAGVICFRHLTPPQTGMMVCARTVLGAMLCLGLSTQDPGVMEAFQNAERKDRRRVESSTTAFRAVLQGVVTTSLGLMKTLLKVGGETRGQAVGWVADAVRLNASAESFRRDPQVTAPEFFLLNLGSIMLELSMPFVSDATKFSKMDAGSLLLSEPSRRAIWPVDVTLLVEAGEDAESLVRKDGEELEKLKSFITQCFFLTWRTLHLGVLQSASRHNRLHRELGHWNSQVRNGGNPQAQANFSNLLFFKLVAEVQLCEPGCLGNALLFFGMGAKWLYETLSQPDGGPLLHCLPQHLVEDIPDFLLFVERYAPKVLDSGGPNLSSVMDLVVLLLSQPSLVRSPHLRAKLGDVLYWVFLPPSEREGGSPGQRSQPHTALLYMHRMAQTHLAPSLLLLYGDVESTGFYDKLEHRFHIAMLLKYLWQSPEHRSTFRRIAGDTQSFVRFANGLMNETNALVASVMEKLPEIRQTQQLQRDPAGWGAMNEEARNQALERLSESERTVTSNLLLCNETLHMMVYLTSDPEIQKPFLLPELLPRLASALLSVLSQLVGSKGLEIKVDNPDQYNFRPKDMLRDVATVILHFADHAAFHEAFAASGFYDPKVLPKAIQTILKTGIMSPADANLLSGLSVAVAAAFEVAAAAESDLGEIPDEFLDPVRLDSVCTLRHAVFHPLILLFPPAGHGHTHVGSCSFAYKQPRCGSLHNLPASFERAEGSIFSSDSN